MKRYNDHHRAAGDGGHAGYGDHRFETIRVSIPSPRTVGVGAGLRPRDVLSVEELRAIAEELSDLARDARFREIPEDLTIDHGRRASARRRVPPRFEGAD